MLRQLRRPLLEAFVPFGEILFERPQPALLGREVGEVRLSRVECGLALGERLRTSSAARARAASCLAS